MYKKILPLLLVFVFLICGCNEDDIPEESTVTETVTTVDDDSKILVQPWRLADVYASVRFDGVNTGFPFTLDILNGFNDGYSMEVQELSSGTASGFINTPFSGSFYFEIKDEELSELYEASEESGGSAPDLSDFYVDTAFFPEADGIPDFEIYGVTFNSFYKDVKGIFGIPDETKGDVEGGSFSLSYRRNDTKYIMFLFEYHTVSAVFIKN